MTSPFDELGISDAVLGEPKTRAEAVAMWFNDPVRLQQWLDEQDGLRWVMWDYELRHPGHGDQSVHNPHKGGGSGLGVHQPGVKRPGAGDRVIRADSQEGKDLLAGSAGPHMRIDADGNVSFTPERQALHDKIVADAVLGVPRSADPTLTMMGGGPASGKTTIRAKGEVGVPPAGSKKAVDVNPDDVKTGFEDGTGKPTKAGIPEYHTMKNSGDPAVAGKAASFTHEESSYVSKRIAQAGIERGCDVIIDGTGDSGLDSLGGKLKAAKAAGYKTKGVYVTVPTAVAVGRSRARGLKTGRVVPDSVVRETHINVSRVFPQAASAGLFDSLDLWDNSGSPVLIFSSAKGGVQRNGLYKGFIAKGFEPLP
jgi:predicted ABC-type ATPase